MSAESTAAAATLDALAANAQAAITAYEAERLTHEGALPPQAESQAVAFWVDHCLRAKSILPLARMLFLSGTAPLDVNQRATRWMAVRAEKLLQQKFRAQLVDYATQCRNGDQIHDRVPLTATAAEISTACERWAREYMITEGNNAVALELLGQRLTD
jgi:hypothetical protein